MDKAGGLGYHPSTMSGNQPAGCAATDYRLCGWRVRSALPLPELLPWTGDPAAPPDIRIEEGLLPDRLDGPGLPGRYLMVGDDGGVLLEIPGLVRLLVRGGTDVTVQRLSRDADEAWRLFLLGAALGYLCHQRGVLPLHAATLYRTGPTGPAAIAIAGRRGAGKSTLALALTGAGYGLLSDDLTVIRPDPDIVPVLPAYPRLKLWRASLDAAGVPIEGFRPVRAGMEKYDLRPAGDFDPAPMPLRAVVILEEGDALAMTRLEATQALPALHPHVCRRRVGALLGRRRHIFTGLAAIVRRIPVYILTRPKRFELLAETTELIDRTLRPGTR
jgi:hypothetical protein